jgi:cytochrome c
MLDTVTLTKAAAAFLGAWLIFLLGSWAAESLFTIGHHGDDHQQAYVIPTEDDAPEEEVEELTIEEKFAQADAGAGERVFGKCRACHQLEDGANATGPHLYAVVGREVGVVDGFNYSGALSEQADVWTEENLYAFLEDPRGWAPGTSMSFAGLDTWEDRVNLIAYLQANTN